LIQFARQISGLLADATFEELDLKGNAISKNKHYRYLIVSRYNNLQVLDGTYVFYLFVVCFY
jgi:hypothetical protein